MDYKVFLSSTSKDLATHREAVTRAISGLDGFYPIVMETFGARDGTASQIDEAKIRECDVFVGLVGHCYGSSPKDNPTSYTEQEFDLATSLGRPRLMLVASDEFRLPASLREPEEKHLRQVAFRTRVMEGRVVATFDDPAGLAGLVTQALANWRAEREKVDQITEELIAAKEHAAELERTLAEEREALRAAVQALADKAREPDAPPKVEQALALLPEGRTAEAEAIFAEIVERKQVEGMAALQEAAAAARHLGALAYLDSTQKAIEAYATATRLDPDHVWSWILLGRLHLRAGSLAGAAGAFDQARAAAERAGSEGDVGVTYHELGMVRQARGDLAGAFAAYQRYHEIAEKLAAQDPSNTGWQRELSVVHNKIGDVQRARGNLDAALKAYQDGLDIAEKLAAQDPSNTEWQRDLSVSCERIGNVESARGNLDAALKAYQDGLAIREKLAAQDPSNSGWQRDLSVSFEKIGDVQRARAIATPRSTPIRTAWPSARSSPRRTRATPSGSATSRSAS
jgi:tetratricopeptide (TPR) repeat protein